ncbi:MAG: hypothetical protein J6C56_07630 [Alistipes sp.]|nr:hypothetical protein [Alistipes sp.]
MFKNLSYLWLSLAIMALQIFLIDELSIAMWLRPMIFPLVVILLQMEWRPIWVLLTSALVGLTMDLALGGSGLYTATIVPLAVIRRGVMYFTTKRSIEHGDQTSLLSRLSSRQLLAYTSMMMFIHHAMFFIMETLSFAHPMQLFATIVCSTLLSMLVAWPILRIFTLKIVSK